MNSETLRSSDSPKKAAKSARIMPWCVSALLIQVLCFGAEAKAFGSILEEALFGDHKTSSHYTQCRKDASEREMPDAKAADFCACYAKRMFQVSDPYTLTSLYDLWKAGEIEQIKRNSHPPIAKECFEGL